MMSHDDSPAKQATSKDHENNQGSGNRKSGTTTRPQEQNLNCPRCDSPNTKFCYYNNYSLTQPRHFCKTCRRYWTKGGALRNVPIGGGCRKNKKVKSSRLSCDSKDSGNSSSDHLGGLKFLHALSPPVEFQLGGLPFLHHPPPTTSMYNQFSSFGDVSATSSSVTSASTFNLDHSTGTPSSLLGLNYPFSSSTATGINGANAAIQGMSSLNVHSNLASSIESLSSINQDLHWKLQQQRLAMLFGGDNHKDSNHVSQVNNQLENQTQKPQPILFQNLEISKPDTFPIGSSRKEGPSSGGDIPTEWFFGNSYASVTAPTQTTTSGGGHGDDNVNNWSSGVHAWGDVHQQYSALP